MINLDNKVILAIFVQRNPKCFQLAELGTEIENCFGGKLLNTKTFQYLFTMFKSVKPKNGRLF